MTEEQKNNVENCDQFTKPEEISALKKYLRALKEDLEERTELETESQMMDPSYREEKAHLDTSREKLIGGENPLLNLPGTKETIDVEKLSRLDQMRVRLEGNNDNLESLSSSLDKIQFINDSESLSDELIKISGKKELGSLSNDVEKVGGNTEELQKLSGSSEKLGNIGGEVTLSDSVEKLDRGGGSETLSNSVEKLDGEKKQASLSDSVEKLNLSGEENVLSKELDPIQGEEKKIVLSDELDKIGGVKEKVILSDEIDKIKNPLENIDLDKFKEKIKGENQEASLGSVLERIHDPFKKPEKLDDSLEKVNTESSGKVNLSSYLDRIIKPEEEKTTSLSEEVEEVSGNFGTSIDSLPKNKEFIENPPKNQTLGKRILNKIRGVERIDKLSGDKEIVRGTIQDTQLSSFLDSPIEISLKEETEHLDDTLEHVNISDKKETSLGEERQEIPFRGGAETVTLQSKIEENVPSNGESVGTNKGLSLGKDKEIVPGEKYSGLSLERELLKTNSVNDDGVSALDSFLDATGKITDGGVENLDDSVDRLASNTGSDTELDNYIDRVSGKITEPTLNSTQAEFPRGDKKSELELDNYLDGPSNTDAKLELDKKRVDFVVDDKISGLDNFSDKLSPSDTGIDGLNNVLDRVKSDGKDVNLDKTSEKLSVHEDKLELGDTLDKINVDQEKIDLNKFVEKLHSTNDELGLGDVLEKIKTGDDEINLGNVLDKIDTEDTLDELPNVLSKDERLKYTNEESLSDVLNTLPFSKDEDDPNLSDYLDTINPSVDLEQVGLENKLESDGIPIKDQNPLTDSKIFFDESGLGHRFGDGSYIIQDQDNTTQKTFFSKEGLVNVLEESGFVRVDQSLQDNSKLYFEQKGLIVEIQEEGFIVHDQDSETVEKFNYVNKGLESSLDRDGYILPDQELDSESKRQINSGHLESSLSSSESYIREDQEINSDSKLFYTRSGLRYELQEDGYLVYDQNTGTQEKFYYLNEGLTQELHKDGKIIYDQEIDTPEKLRFSEAGLVDDLVPDSYPIVDQENSLEEKIFFSKEGLRYELHEDGFVIFDQTSGEEKKVYFENKGLIQSLESGGILESDRDPLTEEKIFFNYLRGLHNEGGLRKNLTDQGKPQEDQAPNTDEKRSLEEEKLRGELKLDGKIREDENPNTLEKSYLKENTLRKSLPDDGTTVADLINSIEKSYLRDKGLRSELNKEGTIREDQVHTSEKHQVFEENSLESILKKAGIIAPDQKPSTDAAKSVNYNKELGKIGLASSLEKPGKVRKDQEETLEKNDFNSDGLTKDIPSLGKKRRDQEETEEKEEFQKEGLSKVLQFEGKVRDDQDPHTPEKDYLNYDGEFYEKGLRKELPEDGLLSDSQEIQSLEEELSKYNLTLEDQNPGTPEKEFLNDTDEFRDKGLRKNLSEGELTIEDQNPNTPEKEFLHYEGRYHDKGLKKNLSEDGKTIKDQNPNTPEKEFLHYEGRFHESGLKKELPEDGETVPDQIPKTERKISLKRGELEQDLSQQGILTEDQDPDTRQKDILNRLGLKSELDRDGILSEMGGDEKKIRQLSTDIEVGGRIREDQDPDTSSKEFIEERGLRSELDNDSKLLDDKNRSTPIKENLRSDKLENRLDDDGRVLEDKGGYSEVKSNLKQDKLVGQLQPEELVGTDKNTSLIKDDLNSGYLRDYLEADGKVGEDHFISPIKEELVASDKLRDYLETDGKVAPTIGPPKSRIEKLAVVLDNFIRDNAELSEEEARQLFEDLLLKKAKQDTEITEDDHNTSIFRQKVKEGWLHTELPDGGTIRRTVGPPRPQIDELAVIFDNFVRDNGEISESEAKQLFNNLILHRAEENKQITNKDQNPETESKLYVNREGLKNHLDDDQDLEEDLNPSPLRKQIEKEGLQTELPEDGIVSDLTAPESSHLNQLAIIFDGLARGEYGELSDSQLEALYNFLLDFRGKTTKERTREDQIRYSIDGTIGKQFDPDSESLPDAVLGISRGRVIGPDGIILDDPDRLVELPFDLPDDAKTKRTEGPPRPNINQLAVIFDNLIRGDYGSLEESSLKAMYDFLLDFRAKVSRENTRKDQNPTTDAKARLDEESRKAYPLSDLTLEEDGKVRPTEGIGKPLIDPLAVALDKFVRDDENLSDEELEQLYNSLLLTRAQRTRDELGQTKRVDKPDVDPLALALDSFLRDKNNLSEEEAEQLYNDWLLARALSEKSDIPEIDADRVGKLAVLLDNLASSELTEEQAQYYDSILEQNAQEGMSLGGRVPKSETPRTEPDGNTSGRIVPGQRSAVSEYEYFFGDGSDDTEALSKALQARAEHKVQKYSSYLLNYASSKDLGGWGKKLQSLLSKFSSGSYLTANQVKKIEGDIENMAKEYYEKEGKIYITYSHVPNNLDAMLNANNYLRFVADEVRRGYNALNKKGGFWRTLDNFTGIKEHAVDMILWALIKARDQRDEYLKINLSRLPDSNVTDFDRSANGSLGENIQGLLSTTLDNASKNLMATLTGGRYINKPDKSKPFNRPHKREQEEKSFVEENFDKNVVDIIIESSQRKEKPTPPGNDWRNTLGWTDPNITSTEDMDLSELMDKEGNITFKSILKRSFVEAFNPDVKADFNSKVNYYFKENYMLGTGMMATLRDLTESGDTDRVTMTPSTFNQALIESRLFSHPGKFTKFRSLVDDMDDGTVWTLDSDAYWEITIEPYLGWDNGFCSYLPSVEEINAKNWIQHNVITSYSQWFPIVDFTLSKSKLDMKTLGIYGGEISFPGGIEFSNELRLTMIDDSYKSFRQFFEKCMYVGVYNSNLHHANFYGYNRDVFVGPEITYPQGFFNVNNCKVEDENIIFDPTGRISGEYKVSPEIFNRAKMFCIPNPYMITVVDKTSPCLALYKNITFRIRIYIFTPQLSTINKYDLLCVLKDMSEERKGAIEGAGEELELSFSIVGENPNPDWNLDYGKIRTEEAVWMNSPAQEEKEDEGEDKDNSQQQQKAGQKQQQKNNNQRNRAKASTPKTKKEREVNRSYTHPENRDGRYRSQNRGQSVRTSSGNLRMGKGQ